MANKWKFTICETTMSTKFEENDDFHRCGLCKMSPIKLDGSPKLTISNHNYDLILSPSMVSFKNDYLGDQIDTLFTFDH